MAVTGVEQGGSVTARQQALRDYMAAVSPRLDKRLELDEGSPVGEVVKMIQHADKATLEVLGAWACVLWDRAR